MIKVLFVSPNGYLGGAERFVITAATAHQSKKNISVGILFFSEGEACSEARLQKIEYFVLKNKFRLRSPFKLIRSLLEIRKIVKNFNPDVLHLTMPYSHIVLSLATFGLGIKKVWFQHGPVGGLLDKSASFFPVDAIWYNSKDLKNNHYKTVPRVKVNDHEAIINLGIKSNNKVHEIFKSDLITLGSAGRICSWKGFHNIIKALGELKQEQAMKPYRFFLAGSAKTINDQNYYEELVELVRKYKLENEFIFFHHVEDMENFYQGLDVFVHSSIIPEPFGLVVAEAMANGCLIIGSNKGGVTDLLHVEKTGLTYSSTKKNAVEELKIILGNILLINSPNDIERFRLIAIAGKMHVRENYSITGMISQMENLYFKLLKSE